jgi:hypothetical protein
MESDEKRELRKQTHRSIVTKVKNNKKCRFQPYQDDYINFFVKINNEETVYGNYISYSDIDTIVSDLRNHY